MLPQLKSRHVRPILQKLAEKVRFVLFLEHVTFGRGSPRPEASSPRCSERADSVVLAAGVVARAGLHSHAVAFGEGLPAGEAR